VSTVPVRVTQDATRHVPLPDAPMHDTAVVARRQEWAWTNRAGATSKVNPAFGD